MNRFMAQLDPSKGVLVVEGERLRAHQPLGRGHHGGYELAPYPGTVRSIRFDASGTRLLVQVEGIEGQEVCESHAA